MEAAYRLAITQGVSPFVSIMLLHWGLPLHANKAPKPHAVHALHAAGSIMIIKEVPETSCPQ